MKKLLVMGLLGGLLAFGCSDDGDNGVGTDPCTGEEPDPTCSQACDDDGDCPTGFHCGPDGTCNAQCGPDGGCPGTHECSRDEGRCEPVSGPCASDDPPADCEKDCEFDVNCERGLFCEGSICTAECDPDTHEGCNANQFCNIDGTCLDGARPTDASTDTNSCPPTQITADPVTPTVVLIVDQSGSMNQDFGCSGCERWNVVRSVLLDDPDGLVTQLQDVVRFGLALYTASNCDNGSGCGDCACTAPANDPCPDITEVNPALSNRAAIATTFVQDDWEEDTPTGDSVYWVTNWLRGFAEVPDTGTMTWDGNPIVYVLATDGEPDMCSNGDPTSGSADEQLAKDMSVDAVAEAATFGIDTYVINVGVPEIADHLNAVAVAGNTTEAKLANNAGELTTELANIVSGALSCDIALQGDIQNLANVCNEGSVSLTVGGEPVAVTCQGTCDTASGDGWCAIDSSNIRILGAPCDSLRSGQEVQLNATFDCGAFVGR